MVTRATSVPNSIDKIDSNKTFKKRSVICNKQKTKKSMVRSRSLTNNSASNSNNNQNSTQKNNSNKCKNNIVNNSMKLCSKGSDLSLKSQDKNAPVLIRSRGNEIGSADTLEIIATKSTGSEPSTPEDNINVVVRVRPLSDKERKCGDTMVLQFPGNGQILCDGKNTGNSSAPNNIKLFTYNVVFEPGATQQDILEYSGIKRIIEMAIEGFSCTAFCYGQTGSGKTHTLTGPPELFEKKPDPHDERHGLIFRSFIYLFQLLRDRKDTNFVLKASFLEIYNEKVIDLLNSGTTRKPLAVRWSKKLRGFFVENLFTVDCEELDDLLAVLEEGIKNRVIGSHQMNDYSSRSHTILTVHIISEHQAENGVFISKQGKVNFVDLAGSEMTKKTLSEGKTLEEANNINKSLMVLGYCIASLSDSKKRTGHIPYRDSQLTKLLADSLAGNGVTLMIACVSPSQSNYSETLNTLRYASRAKKIRTKPIVVMDPREALILSLKREINVLQIENEHLKAALNFHNENLALTQMNSNPNGTLTNNNNWERIQIPEAPKIDVERLTELENSELVELIKLYVVENKALRDENSQLYTTRDMILRDQELVCRENERLLKKLEDVNSVCVRSPLIPARSALSSSPPPDNSSEIWTNPSESAEPITKSQENFDKKPKEKISGNETNQEEHQLPESIQKEMEKRRIGTDNIIRNRIASSFNVKKQQSPQEISNQEKSPENIIRTNNKKITTQTTSNKEEINLERKASENINFMKNHKNFSFGEKDLFGSTVSLDDYSNGSDSFT